MWFILQWGRCDVVQGSSPHFFSRASHIDAVLCRLKKMFVKLWTFVILSKGRLSWGNRLGTFLPFIFIGLMYLTALQNRLFIRAARVIEFEKLREICGDYQHLNYAKGMSFGRTLIIVLAYVFRKALWTFPSNVQRLLMPIILGQSTGALDVLPTIRERIS